MSTSPPARTADDAAATTAPTDPYVIYQLRKPCQRGTAVIPRFVPNTHAPAFSPANYRFSRVWAAADPATGASPTALLNAPRSFEYAGSLGSESSFWSDTSSWVSVSSLRTAQSEVRAPLLHGASQPVSAASFFNSDFDRPPLRRATVKSAASSDIDDPVRPDFRYPPALSESVSEDAVVDDLLSERSNQPPPQAPSPRQKQSTNQARPPRHTQSTNQARSISPSTKSTVKLSQNPHPRKTSSSTTPTSTHSPTTPNPAPSHISFRPPFPSKSSPSRSAVLPALTRKRRSLWQWLFCSDNAAGSTTVPSVTAPPQRSSTKPRTAATGSNTYAKSTNVSRDRVPGSDKDFLQRATRAPDASTTGHGRRNSNRRSPSFEIRRGRPDHGGNTRRSVSWSFVPKAFQRSDQKKKKKQASSGNTSHHPSFPVSGASAGIRWMKSKTKQKDRARGIVVEEKKASPAGEAPRGHRISFQKTLARKETPAAAARRKAGMQQAGRTRNEGHSDQALRRERPQDRPREDRPRGDRPRQAGKIAKKDSSSGPPVQASVVPSLREKTGGSISSHSQRMRSGESSDQIESRISSDLTSSTTIERMTGSGSGQSTPVLSRRMYPVESHELDPAANGVSSDVSSHVSHGKISPLTHGTDPGSVQSGASSSIDFDAIQARRISRGSPLHSELFAFPSSSSEGGGVVDSPHKNEWEIPTGVYPEYRNTPVRGRSDATDESAALNDPVARALEKNRARSAGGPLSYLMRQPEMELDVNTQSTGLTSLADESVSTHKTISAAGDEYPMLPQGITGYRFRETKKLPPRSLPAGHDAETSDGSGAGRPIFRNSALFNYSGHISPSGVSNGSPNRFHSDWSDPHATDIDVYCQCNCKCVYEEECRRSCELVYGRSPSVSSTRSCSRPGFPGFQTLPPAMDAAVHRQQKQGPKMVEASDEPLAFMGRMKPMVGPAMETRDTQRTFNRASELDELRDPGFGEQGMQTSSVSYHRTERGQGMSDVGDTRHARPLQMEDTAAGYRRREEQYERRRHASLETGVVGRSHLPGGKAGRMHESEHHGMQTRPRHSRQSEYSPRHRSSSQTERHGSGNQSRSSSQRTPGTSASSRQSSGVSRRTDTPRNVVKDEGAEALAAERQRREWENRRRYGSRRQGDGQEQMGKNYVVKRNGMPPSGKTMIPEPYRASGYGRDVSYDYDEEEHRESGGRSGRLSYRREADLGEPGQTPKVQLEFETGGIGAQDGYRQPAGRNGGSRIQSRSTTRAKAETGPRQRRRTEGGGRKSGTEKRSGGSKLETRAASKQVRPTARSNVKSSSGGRSRMLQHIGGIFS